MKRVGLIGCGAIGTVLAEAIERKIVVCDELVIFDVDAAKAEKLKDSLKFPVKIMPNVDELLASKPSIVVEAASQQAVKEYYNENFSCKHRLHHHEHRRTFRSKHKHP